MKECDKCFNMNFSGQTCHHQDYDWESKDIKFVNVNCLFCKDHLFIRVDHFASNAETLCLNCNIRYRMNMPAEELLSYTIISKVNKEYSMTFWLGTKIKETPKFFIHHKHQLIFSSNSVPTITLENFEEKLQSYLLML